MSNECQITLTAPVTHDGVMYSIGEIVPMSFKHAARLVRLGCGVIDSDGVAMAAVDTQITGRVIEPIPPVLSDEQALLEQTSGHHAQTGERLMVEALLGNMEPKDMTLEELEAELTAAGIEIRDGMSEKALMARVIKLRKDGE